jgi:hypothetical protein
MEKGREGKEGEKERRERGRKREHMKRRGGRRDGG